MYDALGMRDSDIFARRQGTWNTQRWCLLREENTLNFKAVTVSKM